MTNSEVYNIVSENELSEVIAHFNTEFIMSIIDSAIAIRYNPSAFTNNPNVVDAWDMNFKQIVEYYQNTDMTERVAVLRANTYKEIIDRICRVHDLNFTVEEVDLYTAAHYLYQFLVSQFIYYMDYFFASYIVREADALFDGMELGMMRKNKDTSTVYNKRIFKNEKIAVIAANIDRVVQYICGMDFSFDYIAYNCGFTREEAEYILRIVSPASSFFTTCYVPIISNDLVRPMHLNNIRFMIRDPAEPGNETFAAISTTTTDEIDPIV